MKPASHYTRKNTRKIVYFTDAGALVGPTDDLLSQIRPNDLVIVNDSATAPSMLNIADASGRKLELRFIKGLASYRVIAFEGDSWKTPTERRQPAVIKDNENLMLGQGTFRINHLGAGGYSLTPSKTSLSLMNYLYKKGSMIQYSYMEDKLPVWANQTIFASRPWSSEAPSAAFAITWRLVFGIIAKGAQIVAISHGAGLSSVGNDIADHDLPLPEISQVGRDTLEKIEATKRSGGRVIAIGTSVVRAVEAAWIRYLAKGHDNQPFLNSLIISGATALKVFDGILSGLHDNGESHFKLLSSFSSPDNIQILLKKAEDTECLTHEFGDFMLLFSVQKNTA